MMMTTATIMTITSIYGSNRNCFANILENSDSLFYVKRHAAVAPHAVLGGADQSLPQAIP